MELATATDQAASNGELLRLQVLVQEARDDYWKASAQDRDAYEFLWNEKFDEPGKSIHKRLKPFYLKSDPVRLEQDGATVGSFFDFWGEEGRPRPAGDQVTGSRLIDEAEHRLGIRVSGLLRDLFTYDNGGYTDYVNYPLTPWAQLATPPSEFRNNWFNPFASDMLVSVQHWKSVDTFFAESSARLAEMGIEAKRGWSTSLPGLDRLIVLTASESKGTSAWTLFCLDFRQPGEPGAMLLHENEPFGGTLHVIESWPSFERLFRRLRRFELQELDGIVRWRDRVVEILDGDRWRAPRG
jgi:hypothetical protein